MLLLLYLYSSNLQNKHFDFHILLLLYRLVLSEKTLNEVEHLKAHLHHDEDDDDPLKAGSVLLIKVTLEQLHQLHTVTQLDIHHLRRHRTQGNVNTHRKSYSHSYETECYWTQVTMNY